MIRLRAYLGLVLALGLAVTSVTMAFARQDMALVQWTGGSANVAAFCGTAAGLDAIPYPGAPQPAQTHICPDCLPSLLAVLLPPPAGPSPVARLLTARFVPAPRGWLAGLTLPEPTARGPPILV